jgi:hypothetical protein
LLKGRIQNLHKTRQNHDFVFSAADRTKMGAAAIGAALVGMGGMATGLNSMDTREIADLLEFDLDGKPVRAWVWVSVFNEGDEVEVVAEPMGDFWQGYGIRRPQDKIVALHPHCSRGRYAHYRASFRWYLKISLSLLFLSYLILFGESFIYGPPDDWVKFILVLLGGGVLCMGVLGLIAFNVARKLMGFVRLAEKIFEFFGWPDVRNIDLPAITKKGEKPDDPILLGVLYFRY